MSNIKLLQLQYALFFKFLENRPDKLISKVDEIFKNVFDQMPNIMKLPSDAPADIPRVIMQSSDNVYLCNISKKRIGIVKHLENSDSEIGEHLEKFIENVISLSNNIFEDRKITRFGLVGQYFIQSDNAINDIASKYMTIDIDGIEELSIRFNRNFESKDLKMNDVVDISKGFVLNNNSSQQDGIIVQRDVNNKPVDNLDLETLKHVVASAKEKFTSEKILELIKR